MFPLVSCDVTVSAKPPKTDRGVAQWGIPSMNWTVHTALAGCHLHDEDHRDGVDDRTAWDPRKFDLVVLRQPAY